MANLARVADVLRELGLGAQGVLADEAGLEVPEDTADDLAGGSFFCRERRVVFGQMSVARHESTLGQASGAGKSGKGFCGALGQVSS